VVPPAADDLSRERSMIGANAGHLEGRVAEDRHRR
jgi:hypothetical protein